MDILLKVNGQKHHLARSTFGSSLLDELREGLGLIGTKKGCDL